MPNVFVNDEYLKATANAIRSKFGKSQTYFPSEMASAILSVPNGDNMKFGKKPIIVDPHTLLLLHGDTLTDSSKFNVPLTNNGVVVSTAQSKFGGKSLYFNGNSCIKYPQNATPFKEKNFTIDWWENLNPSTNSKTTRFCSTAGPSGIYGGLLLGYNVSKVFCGTAVNNWNILSGSDMFDVTKNSWVHWAVVRNGSTLTTYKNGKKFASANFNGSIIYDTQYPIAIGAYTYYADTGHWLQGYIDEFRISDVARWTSDFTPPTKPYDNLI